MSNYWDDLMTDDEGAANYMETYGEGPGFDTRHTIGYFINDGETVLDVGCGPGWNYEHFRKYGPKVHYKGLDYSERFVRVANKRVGLDVFYKGDVRDIQEPDYSWDVVILQDVLEHTNGYEKSVGEALRVARKRVIISFWRMSEGERDKINDDGNDGYGAAYSRSKWGNYLNSLPYVWHHLDIQPEGKTHKWDFYILDKENS